MDWFSGFEPIVQRDVSLREHTWYRLGGLARWLCEPRSELELASIMRRVQDAELPWRVLGGGANVLVRDEGFDGMVLRLRGPEFEQVRIDGDRMHAGAGADLQKLIQASLRAGLVGLEALAGIPGTAGGAVRMNAGGRYGEIGSFVHTVRVLDPDGNITTRTRDECGFAYRRSKLADTIVLSVAFALQHGDAESAERRYQRIWKEKHTEQPPLKDRTAGCIFKNPPDAPAGRLLDEAGLKGTRVGGAEISTRHANFIVAHADATAADVIELIRRARERVYETTGIALEPEVEIW